MKLHELEIGDARTRVIRESDSVAGRNGRVRRLPEDLPRTTRRENRRGRAHFARVAASIEIPHAGGAALVDDEIGHQRVIDRLD